MNKFIVTILLFVASVSAFAANTPPPPPTPPGENLPIPGIGYLVIAAISYGIYASKSKIKK